MKVNVCYKEAKLKILKLCLNYQFDASANVKIWRINIFYSITIIYNYTLLVCLPVFLSVSPNLAFRTLRAHLLFQLWTCSLCIVYCIHCKTKTNKNFVDFQNIKSTINLSWGLTTNFCPIGSPVLRFFGYKQTNTQGRR